MARFLGSHPPTSLPVSLLGFCFTGISAIDQFRFLLAISHYYHLLDVHTVSGFGPLTALLNLGCPPCRCVESLGLPVSQV